MFTARAATAFDHDRQKQPWRRQDGRQQRRRRRPAATHRTGPAVLHAARRHADAAAAAARRPRPRSRRHPWRSPARRRSGRGQRRPRQPSLGRPAGRRKDDHGHRHRLFGRRPAAFVRRRPPGTDARKRHRKAAAARHRRREQPRTGESHVLYKYCCLFFVLYLTESINYINLLICSVFFVRKYAITS